MVRLELPVELLSASPFPFPARSADLPRSRRTSPRPAVGARVVVPLGSRVVTGIVVDVDAAPDRDVDARRQADSADVLDAEPFVPADVVELARWTAEYYAAGAGRDDHGGAAAEDARRAGRRAQDAVRVAAITAAGLETVARRAADRRRRRRAKQREALDLLAGAPARHADARSSPRAAFSADDAARGSRGAALISLRQDRVDRDPFDDCAARSTRR